MVSQFLSDLVFRCVSGGLILAVLAGPSYAEDWPMLGRDATRNAVSPENDPPTFWQIEGIPQWDEPGRLQAPVKTENVRWFAELGVHTFSTPVAADGLVWVGTANSRPDHDRPSLLKCFRERDGKLLYQYESMPLGNYPLDSPWLGISSTPHIEGDLLWFTSNRGEVVCLDIGPLQRGEGAPVVAWKHDMRKEWGVSPYTTVMGPGPIGSVAVYKRLLYVLTNNGVDRAQRKLVAPQAPSLVCLDKRTGELVWQDNSPGANILEAQWGAPLAAEIEGRAQVIVPQGDGWLRAFDALTGTPIWQFDINPKESRWIEGGRGDRNYFLTAPVYNGGRIYIASGQEMEYGEGYGRLVCIDPTKTGDVSSELAVDAAGNPLEHRRIQAADRSRGERSVPNPNSALIWEHGGMPLDEYNKLPFEDQMHRSMSQVAIHDGLLVAVDFSGLVTCLDATTGKRYWRHDLLAAVLTSPLIVDGKVYILDEDGEMTIYQLSREANADGDHPPIAEFMAHPAPSGASPIFANGTLYVAGRRVLLATANEKQASATDEPTFGGHWPQWRGPNRDNISPDAGLAKQWPKEGPPLRWRVNGLGDGISTVSVAGGSAFALGQFDATEFVHALDEQTGKHRWTARLGEAPPQSRLMRWLTQRPPTVDEDRVYAVSVLGELVCLQAADGKELWRKTYMDDFAGKRGLFGYSDCPLIHGEKLLCTPGGAEASLVALNKRTGETLWKCAVPDAGHAAYGNGVIAEIAGCTQIVAFLANSLVGVAVDDGRLLWRRGAVIDEYMHPHTPIVRDRSIVCVNAFGKPGLYVLEVDFRDGAWTVKEVVSAPSNHLARLQDDSVLLDERLYDTSTNVLSCFDIRTAAPVWQQRIGAATPAMSCAGGQLYLHYSDSVIRLVEISADGPDVRGEFQLPDHQNSLGTSTPVVTAGSLYIREDDQLFCYDAREGASHPVDAAKSITLPHSARRPGIDDARPSRVGTDRAPDAIFVPTPHDVVEKMLDLAGVKESDLVYDLGSGDGRIVIAAAKRGARSVGYEIDPELVKLARDKVRDSGLADKASIEHEDIFTIDLSRADVICTFFYPRLMEKLIPQLDRLKPGSRIVSHQFEMPGARPDRVITISSAESGSAHTLYLWTTPLAQLGSPK